VTLAFTDSERPFQASLYNNQKLWESILKTERFLLEGLKSFNFKKSGKRSVKQKLTAISFPISYIESIY